MRAIKGSRISIVIFSTRYASSRWCLNELVKIMECRRTYGQVVLPVFYRVDPSHVRKQWGAFGNGLEALAQKCILEGTHDVLNSWKSALTEASNLAG
ncbi:Disease resistance protein RPS6 [Spatholobus suberectus]|nr:Disease resistance protein RPS6 [Spatholobus suberectus]